MVVAAIDDSAEFRLGIRMNAKMDQGSITIDLAVVKCAKCSLHSIVCTDPFRRSILFSQCRSFDDTWRFEPLSCFIKVALYRATLFLGVRGISTNGASARLFKKNFYLMTSLKPRV